MRFAPVLLASALFAVPASAISGYRSTVPNGALISCRACHTSSGGGEGWNPFGKDVLRQDPDVQEADLTSNNQNVNYSGQAPSWDAALCDGDSDGDGQSNGEELGDPGCIWTSGTAPRTTEISNPGDPGSTSSNPTGVDGAEGEGEGEGEGEPAEGEGEGEPAEGEGEGEEPGGCSTASSASSSFSAFALAGLLALARRRRR